MKSLGRTWWRQKSTYLFIIMLALLFGLIMSLTWVSHRERHHAAMPVERRPRISTVPFPPPSEKSLPIQPDSSLVTRSMAYHNDVQLVQALTHGKNPLNPFFHLIITAEQLAQNAPRDLGLFIHA